MESKWPNELKKIEKMNNKTIALGSDHAGFELKNELIEYLFEKGYGLADMGPDSADSVDYPDYAHKVATAVTDGSACLCLDLSDRLLNHCKRCNDCSS